jgi:hypothetical protein
MIVLITTAKIVGIIGGLVFYGTVGMRRVVAENGSVVVFTSERNETRRNGGRPGPRGSV